jgi:hypothetical protein
MPEDERAIGVPLGNPSGLHLVVLSSNFVDRSLRIGHKVEATSKTIAANMAPYRTSMTFPTAILVVNPSGLIISFIAVVLRLWMRKLGRAKLRLSDYTIVASWVGFFENQGGDSLLIVDSCSVLGS